MRLFSLLKTALLGSVIVALPACSMIGDMFPDKQKNYRYSSELPDLEIPPDLDSPSDDSNKIGSSKQTHSLQDTYSANDATSNTDAKTKSAKADTSTQSKGKKHKPVSHNDNNVTLAQNLENAALIEIQEPYEEAWNDVGRALGRLKLEISDQNQSDGVYYVYYGGVPPKKPGEETSFWDDVGSLFSSDADQAKEYRIKLEDKDSTTNVYVMDQEGKAISDGAGLGLLKRLHKKLITLDQPDTSDKAIDEDTESPPKDDKNPMKEKD